MNDKKVSVQNLGNIGKSRENSCCAPGDSCCTPQAPAGNKFGSSAITVKVFDPPMCCSTGVCGPSVSPELVRFAADMKWLEAQGVKVERFNLTQSPKAFVDNTVVTSHLATKGESALPLVLVNDEVVASGTYPHREELIRLVGLNSAVNSVFTPIVAEFVAIGAAIASNCEPCLRHHVKVAMELGIRASDISLAVEMAARIKDMPHSAILKLAKQLTHTENDETTTAGVS